MSSPKVRPDLPCAVTCNLQPATRNPKPVTRNQKPVTRNQKPVTPP